MTSKPITERLTSLGQYAMNSRPDTWPGPDAVDVIQAQEYFEQTDAFFDAVRDWMTQDDDSVQYAAARFMLDARFDHEFERWLDERGEQ